MSVNIYDGTNLTPIAGKTVPMTYTPAPQSMIGDAWVTSHAYAVGDYCIDGNKMYKCKTAHTSTASNRPPYASYWEATSVASQLGYSQTTVGDGITFTKHGVIVTVMFSNTTYGVNGNSQTLTGIVPSGYLPRSNANTMMFSNSLFQKRVEVKTTGDIIIGPAITSGTEGGTNKTGCSGVITYVTT